MILLKFSQVFVFVFGGGGVDLSKIPSVGGGTNNSGTTQFYKIMLSLAWYRNLIRGFSNVFSRRTTAFSQAGKTFQTELLNMNNFPLSCQT